MEILWKVLQCKLLADLQHIQQSTNRGTGLHGSHRDIFCCYQHHRDCHSMQGKLVYLILTVLSIILYFQFKRSLEKRTEWHFQFCFKTWTYFLFPLHISCPTKVVGFVSHDFRFSIIHLFIIYFKENILEAAWGYRRHQDSLDLSSLVPEVLLKMFAMVHSNPDTQQISFKEESWAL